MRSNRLLPLHHANQTSFKPDPSAHIQLKCAGCGNVIVRLRSEIKKNIARGKRNAFCSNGCVGKYRRGIRHHLYKARLTRLCAWCGNEFTTLPWRIRKFCSHRCCNTAFGSMRLMPEGYTFTHKLARNVARLYYGLVKCEYEYCNNTTDLLVHHIDNDQTNNNPENLEILCRGCHSCFNRLIGLKYSLRS